MENLTEINSFTTLLRVFKEIAGMPGRILQMERKSQI